MLILSTTLRSLSHHGARHLPRTVSLVGRHTVGTFPRHGPNPANAGPQSCQFIRQMSGSPTKHLFFVYAPDYERPGMLDHRLSVRGEHLKGVDVLIKNGILKFGGPFLAPELTDDKGRKKMMGSLVIYEAESVEEVRKIIEADIYSTNGVWDKERLLILPFVPSVPWPSN